MTPIAAHITAFLRERLPLQRGSNSHFKKQALEPWPGRQSIQY